MNKFVSRFLVAVLAVFLLASSADAQGRRRAVARPSPVVFQAALDYTPATGALSRVFTYLPIGSTLNFRVIRPDGTVALDVGSTINVVSLPDIPWMSTNAVGSPWNGPLPVDWPSGITTFQTVVTLYGKKYTVMNQVAVNNTEPTSRLGPLDSAFADASGGIMLTGLFYAPPVVVSSHAARMIPLQGGNYIPPGSVPLPAVITVCSPVLGGTQDLYCSTVAVPVIGASTAS